MFWYFDAFRHYLDFRGYAHRRAYWMFMLVHLLISVLVVAVEIAIDDPGWLDFFYSLITLLPFIALTCRRLRDAGLPWWSLCLLFIPVVGVLVLIYFLCLPSQPRATLLHQGEPL